VCRENDGFSITLVDASDGSLSFVTSLINLPRQWRQKCLLALLKTITKNEGFDSTLAMTPRNALTTPLTPLKPSCHPKHGTRGVVLNMQMLL
jgi:hypothetical protein